jgi:uncharacterized protein YabN with tetrapyrrole methylase and pyrophosphatase domain
MARKRGSVACVGLGITLGDATRRTCKEISAADRVAYLGADPVCGKWIRRLNPRAESLYRYYGKNKPRSKTYADMARRIMKLVREGNQVCVAMYGHPGLFVNPTHEVMRQARREGFPAKMLPGLSADAYLFADLGVDPADHGCQSFEATDFVVCRRQADPTADLLIWQVGIIGKMTASYSLNRTALKMLRDDLVAAYGSGHTVHLYEAPLYPLCKPTIDSLPLSSLAEAKITALATLYVPSAREVKPDRSRLRSLNLR